MDRWIKEWVTREWRPLEEALGHPLGTSCDAPTDSPLLSLPVALDSWQSLAPSSVIVDPSIRNFDVAHISTAAMGNFSAARDRCLWGKGNVHPLGRG